MQHNLNQKRVIIIGAGIAGMAACKKLCESGFDAMILEARDRCGGRIWSDNSLGIPIGRGASWIHGVDNNPITRLASQCQAKMLAVDATTFITYDRHAQPISNDAIERFDVKFEQLISNAKQLAVSSNHSMSLAEALNRLINTDELNSTEQDLLKKKLLYFECYIGANYERLSAKYWDSEETWPGDNCYLTSSYQPIVDDLSSSCRIQLNTIVTQIKLKSDIVEIIAGDTSYLADAVIVTVPLGVLQKNLITFEPPLPQAKQDAIKNLGMGIFNITALKFPFAFWNAKAQATICTPLYHSSIAVFFNLHHFTGEPIIVGYSGGETAKQLETLSDSDLLSKMMDGFRLVYGSNIPEPLNLINTRWGMDPFSYGSYSYVAKDASSADYHALAKPILNSLFFAGEATCSKYFATTHGAYLSGIREAEAIIKLFSET